MSEVQAQENSDSNSFLTRDSLFDWSGGPKESLREIGIDLDLSLTQFSQGFTSGDGDKSWQYGSKGDVIASIDAHQLGLWDGLSFKLHHEFVSGDDANTQGDGTTFPVNTAMAFPRIGASDHETSFTLTQQFDNGLTLSLGKFNMINGASRTPLLGGGGVDTFMNTALAAPISGVVPPYLLGGSLSLKTDNATSSVFIYDPRNAQDSDVLRNPFDDGVTLRLSTTIPIKLSGLQGFHNLSSVYSTQEGIDLRDLPQLSLPPELTDEPRGKDHYWYFSYSFQQFLYQDESDSSKGWGVFGEVGVSDGNPNPVRGHVFLGLGGNSFIPNRINDRWGIAYFDYRMSNVLRKAARQDLGIGADGEKGFEAYYNVAVTPWLRLTADVQVINPFPSDTDKVVVAGIRLQTKL